MRQTVRRTGAVCAFGHNEEMHEDATGASAARQRRNRAGDERRERVLRAAVDQFGRFGYASTSIAGIARAAGITDSGVLHHFPTKLALYRTIVLGRRERFGDGFAAPAAGTTLRERLHAGFVASTRDRELLRLQAMLEGEMLIEDHPLSAEYRQSQRDAIVQLAELIEEAIGRNEVASDVDPERLALHVLAMLRGLRAEWAMLPERVDLEAESAIALDRLLGAAPAG